jgi:hypothetical protein
MARVEGRSFISYRAAELRMGRALLEVAAGSAPGDRRAGVHGCAAMKTQAAGGDLGQDQSRRDIRHLLAVEVGQP